jgi:hypothetical protein
MKTTLLVKLFVVLCCYKQPQNDTFKYEVRDVSDTTYRGIIYSPTKYSEGDTIKFNINRNK